MDSYRIVTTNPDSKKVRFVPYDMNPANPGFVSYRGSRILTLKDSFRFVIDESGFVSYRGSQILHVFKRFVSQTDFQKIRLFLRILRILTNPQYYRFTNPYESFGFGFANPLVFKRFVSWIRFVDSITNYPYRDQDSQKFFSNTRFVDSIRKTKNLKRFDSFRFVRIRIRIPHPQIF